MRKRICPTDPGHKRFHTVAHVTEDWLVDEYGNFIEGRHDDCEVLQGPNHYNIWTCAECGCDETKEEA